MNLLTARNRGEKVKSKNISMHTYTARKGIYIKERYNKKPVAKKQSQTHSLGRKGTSWYVSVPWDNQEKTSSSAMSEPVSPNTRGNQTRKKKRREKKKEKQKEKRIKTKSTKFHKPQIQVPNRAPARKPPHQIWCAEQPKAQPHQKNANHQQKKNTRKKPVRRRHHPRNYKCMNLFNELQQEQQKKKDNKSLYTSIPAKKKEKKEKKD